MQAASPRLRKNVASPDAEAGPTPRKDAQRSARSAMPKSPAAKTPLSRKGKIVILASVFTIVALGATAGALYATGALNGVLGIARPLSEAEKVQIEQSKNLDSSSYCPAQDGDLGIAKLYNLFVFKQIFGRKSDVEGRIAAGESIDLEEFGIGTKLSGDCQNPDPAFDDYGRSDLANFSVITSGWFRGNGIGVKHGGISYVTYNGGNFQLSDVENGCPIDDADTPRIDFGPVWSNLVLLNQAMAAPPDTKSYSVRKPWAQYFLYVRGIDDLEYFNINEEDLVGATEIVLEQSPDKGGKPLFSATTTIIINVVMRGDNTDRKFTIPSMGFTGFDGIQNYVLWNFHDYRRISIQRVAWPGSILATSATFEQTSGEIHGTVIAEGWNQEQECTVPQAEIHWYPYLGSVYTTDCTPTPTPSPTTKSPTSLNTPCPTKNPTNAPTLCPTKSPTEAPTVCPTSTPTQSPTACPTNTPTQSPTACPTNTPTQSPTACPTNTPTNSPTKSPTLCPTNSPTKAPTLCPTKSPTNSPTQAPTTQCPTNTNSPTKSPSTPCPTKAPTNAPTKSPSTPCPTKAPTNAPTKSPSTPCPTDAPTTKAPTKAPTACPTKAPTTKAPTKAPTACPTKAPTTQCPTKSPTGAPTKSPTPPVTSAPTYCNRGCGSQTAYAYSSSCRFSTCFLDISGINNNRWGWTLGPISSPYKCFTANIYAGAGQCNPLKGYYVGYLTVYFKSNGDAVIQVHLNSGVTMSEFHVYFGTTKVPKDNNGAFTVAPGQYPQPQTGQLTSPVSGDFTFTYPRATCGGSSPVYFIFHAVTSGC